MSGQITDQNAGLGIGVVQPQSGLDYPFISPGVGFNSEFTTDVRYLFADFYLSYDDKGYYDKTKPYVRNPLRIYWLYGFGTGPDWAIGQQPLSGIPIPAPTHAADLIVIDRNNRVVFDTTTADYFNEINWGDHKIIDSEEAGGRDSYHYKIYEWRKTTKPGETVCRAIKYESLHPNFVPLHQRPTQFCPRQAILDERTIEKIPKRVLAMRVQNGECVTPWFKNKVTLVNGYNTELTNFSAKITNLRRTTDIVVKAIAGAGKGQFGLCSTTPCDEDAPTNVCPPGEDPAINTCYENTGEKLLTLNGQTPDANGNIFVSASGCLWLRKPVYYTTETTAHNYAKVLTPECCATGTPPTPIFSDTGAEIKNILNVGADCPPCCACADYVQVAKYIRNTADKYRSIGDRAREVKLIHEQNIARWGEQLLCRQRKPLTIMLVQQPCPCIDVFVSYCNQCEDCKRGVRLNIAFNSPEAEIAAVSIDHDYTKLSGNNDSLPPTLSGGWPAFSIYYPTVQPKSSVSARLRMCFCPRDSYKITGQLTGTYQNGPILAGCDMSAEAAVADSFVVLDCNPLELASDANAADISAAVYNPVATFDGGETPIGGADSGASLFVWGLTDMTESPQKLGVEKSLRYRQYGAKNEWYTFSAGGQVMLGIKANRTLWAWGLSNTLIENPSFGTYIDEPVQIGTANNWVSVSTSTWRHAAINAAGELWMWGGDIFDSNVGEFINMQATPIHVMPDKTWRYVDCSSDTVFAITTDYALYAWGRNDAGQCGNGIRLQQNELQPPTQITTVTIRGTTKVNEKWYYVRGGGATNIGVGESSVVYAWGVDTSGNLAQGLDFDGLQYLTRPSIIYKFHDVASRDKFVSTIAPSAYSTVVTNTAGEIFAWGRGSSNIGSLGLGYNYLSLGAATPKSIPQPTQITNPPNKWKYVFAGTQVGAGYASVLILDENNKPWGFGSRGYGVFGDLGDNISGLGPSLPTRLLLNGTADTEWVKLEIGAWWTAGLRRE